MVRTALNRRESVFLSAPSKARHSQQSNFVVASGQNDLECPPRPCRTNRLSFRLWTRRIVRRIDRKRWPVRWSIDYLLRLHLFDHIFEINGIGEEDGQHLMRLNEGSRPSSAVGRRFPLWIYLADGMARTPSCNIWAMCLGIIEYNSRLPFRRHSCNSRFEPCNLVIQACCFSMATCNVRACCIPAWEFHCFHHKNSDRVTRDQPLTFLGRRQTRRRKNIDRSNDERISLRRRTPDGRGKQSCSTQSSISFGLSNEVQRCLRSLIFSQRWMDFDAEPNEFRWQNNVSTVGKNLNEIHSTSIGERERETNFIPFE